MKLFLIVIALGFASGCATSGDGHKTFLGIQKYNKNHCAHDAWVLKKKRIFYQQCF